jgi:hypothetical protein
LKWLKDLADLQRDMQRAQTEIRVEVSMLALMSVSVLVLVLVSAMYEDIHEVPRPGSCLSHCR